MLNATLLVEIILFYVTYKLFVWIFVRPAIALHFKRENELHELRMNITHAQNQSRVLRDEYNLQLKNQSQQMVQGIPAESFVSLTNVQLPQDQQNIAEKSDVESLKNAMKNHFYDQTGLR